MIDAKYEEENDIESHHIPQAVGHYSSTDGDYFNNIIKIKQEGRCEGIFRAMIDVTAFVLGIIALYLIGFGPLKELLDIETFMCIIINVISSLMRIMYNICACFIDQEGEDRENKTCCIIINAFIGVCLLIWILEILFKTYIILTE